MANSHYIAPVYKNGKWGYINQHNELVIPFRFDDADVFSENKATVNTGGKINEDGWVEGGRWGVIDANGNYIINPSYDLLNPYSCGRACFRLMDRWGFIDDGGNVIAPPLYSMAEEYADNLAAVQNKEYRYGYLDLHGKVAIGFDFSFAYSFREGLGVAQDEGGWMVMDTQGNIILRPDVRRLQQFIGGRAGAMNFEQRSGFLNSKGEWAIAPVYDEVGWFAEGMAPVSRNGTWGFVNDEGMLAIPLRFDKTGNFNEGVAPARQNKSWGVIDRSGNWIVKPAYEYIYPSTGGLLSFMNEGKAGYMDTKGNIVIPATYADAKPFEAITI
ncbi:MAG TPA: WG repeat-containing protein [Chitinophagaceae bacterium]|nr:WG repeat-containing protein [Chitinophagaceae bacterium]